MRNQNSLCRILLPTSFSIKRRISTTTRHISLSTISNPNSHIYLAGDFNFPDLDWTTDSILPNSNHPSVSRQFLDIINNHNLEQKVLKPTRKDNILDLLLTNTPGSINRIETLPGISDHDIVFFETDLTANQAIKKPRNIFLYKRANYEAI